MENGALRFSASRSGCRRCEPGYGWCALMMAGAGVLIASCEVDRSRPIGPEIDLPPTRVEIVTPTRQQTVPADSVLQTRVRANGLLRAVEVTMRTGARLDTILVEREDLSEPAQAVDLSIAIRIPAARTGTVLELIAAAEDVIGGRRSTDPVPVIVIDCRELEFACR